MKTKTIRFEKGQLYASWKLEYYQGVFDSIYLYFKKRKEKTLNKTRYYECLKSFTVQINIIEDEKDN